MDVATIISLVIGSAGGIGVLTTCIKVGRIIEKIENLDKKIDKLESKVDKGFESVDRRFQEVDRKFEHFEEKFNKKFEDFERKVDAKFEKLENNLPIITIAISKLEVRLEERTIKPKLSEVENEHKPPSISSSNES